MFVRFDGLVGDVWINVNKIHAVMDYRGSTQIFTGPSENDSFGVHGEPADIVRQIEDAAATPVIPSQLCSTGGKASILQFETTIQEQPCQT